MRLFALDGSLHLDQEPSLGLLGFGDRLPNLGEMALDALVLLVGHAVTPTPMIRPATVSALWITRWQRGAAHWISTPTPGTWTRETA